jgi:hypothetical protein
MAVLFGPEGTETTALHDLADLTTTNYDICILVKAWILSICNLMIFGFLSRYPKF